MDNVRILSLELLKLCIPILIGFLACKFKYMENIKDGIGKLISKILFPVMMFCIFSSPNLKTADIFANYSIIVVSCIWIALCFGIGLAVAFLVKAEKKRVAVFSVLMGMGNVTYMGIPICNALFGEQFGTMGAALVSVSGHIVMWSLGVFILTKFSDRGKVTFRNYLNPVIIAIILALILKFTGVTLPAIVYSPLDALGDTTPYIALVYIGMIIAASDFKKAFSDRGVWAFLAVKLVIMPLLLGLVLRIIPESFISADAAQLVFVEFSTSVMISLTPFFKEYGSDSDFAGMLVFTSVILDVFTLPFVMMINSLY